MAEVWAARVVKARGSDRGSGDRGGGDRGGDEDRYVAIKLLASHLAERIEYREMFLAEARLSMQLSHPNIVRVFDAVAHEADCYMVMELVSGMTLSQLERSIARAGGELPLVVTAYVVGELLRALSYAHQVRTAEGSVIVHRDVSPQNVMVTSDGQIKLMDFGIARFATQETQGAFVKGKLQYMPPEQLRKQTRKPTVDLYAVGAILHELLDGKRFRGRIDQAALINMVMHGEVPPLRDPDRIPAQLDVVRRGLLEPDEAARIQTARKALGMLCRWSDYRQVPSELSALVVGHTEPEPNKPASTTTSTTTEVSLQSKVSSVPEGSFSGLQGLDFGAIEELESGHSDPQLHTPSAAQTVPTGTELTAEQDIELLSAAEVVAQPPGSDRRRGRVSAMIGLGAAGLIGVVAAAAMMASGVGTADTTKREEPPAKEAPIKVAARDVVAPAAPTSAAAEPVVEPVVEPPVEPDGTEPVVEPVEPDGTEPPPGPEPLVATVPDRVDVPVEFVANEFFFVYVKVRGKVLTLEPRARLELPEGKHSVYLRQSPDDEWTRAGRINIEPGSEYRVEMRKPASLKLVKK